MQPGEEKVVLVVIKIVLAVGVGVGVVALAVLVVVAILPILVRYYCSVLSSSVFPYPFFDIL